MKVSVHLGGGHHHSHAERRVPRNRHNYHHGRRSSGGGGGGGTTNVTSPITKFFIGLIIIAIAAAVGFFIYSSENKTKDYIETSGYVIDYLDQWDSSGNQYMYTEIIEYTVDGKVYECTSGSSSNIPLPYGSRVTVYYNPINPGVAVVNQKAKNILVYVICGIFCVTGLGVMCSGIKGFITGNGKE